MAWRAGGRRRSWYMDEDTDQLIVHWQPILSWYDDEDEGQNPLDLLTHKQRFVIELRAGWVDGIEYTQREIASLMGISRSMVNQHEQAAKKKLKKYLRRAPAPVSVDREESK